MMAHGTNGVSLGKLKINLNLKPKVAMQSTKAGELLQNLGRIIEYPTFLLLDNCKLESN